MTTPVKSVFDGVAGHHYKGLDGRGVEKMRALDERATKVTEKASQHHSNMKETFVNREVARLTNNRISPPGRSDGPKPPEGMPGRNSPETIRNEATVRVQMRYEQRIKRITTIKERQREAVRGER